VSSKHGVTGLLRASQLWAEKYGVRINGVAPFVTPTNMAEFYDIWASKGLPSNTPEGVANVIAHMPLDPERKGQCCLVSWPGLKTRDLELTFDRPAAPF
jgi:NAD(P)-dependent dehydrogenase (short-subunit alcohol dehydrogenase family)